MNAEGCTTIWKDSQRNGWRLWQLQSFLWSLLWSLWNTQLAEGCGVRCTTWVTYLLYGTCDERLSGHNSCTAKAQALFCVHVTRACQCFQGQVFLCRFCWYREKNSFCEYPVSPLMFFWLSPQWMRFSWSFPTFLTLIRHNFQKLLCNEWTRIHIRQNGAPCLTQLVINQCTLQITLRADKVFDISEHFFCQNNHDFLFLPCTVQCQYDSLHSFLWTFLNRVFRKCQMAIFSPEVIVHINCKMILSFLLEMGNMLSFDTWAILPALIKEILIRFLGITSSYKKNIISWLNFA